MNEARKIVVEEVDAVEAPPKARVESAAETFERKRDYLEGFLAQPPPPVAGGEPGGARYEAVIDAPKEIYDPEIPVKIGRASCRGRVCQYVEISGGAVNSKKK